MGYTTTAPQGKQGQEWSTGLCGCFNDCCSCLLGCFFPSILYGFNHEKITGQPGCFGPCCAFFALQILFGCVCCVSSPTRRHLRSKYGLREEPCSDCCVHFWCVPCAVCQEAREIDYRLATQPPAGAYVPTAGQTHTTHVPVQQTMTGQRY